MSENENKCPRCLTVRLKNWQELTSNEKFVAERMPASAQFSRQQRREHLFCPKCWFEAKPTTTKV